MSHGRTRDRTRAPAHQGIFVRPSFVTEKVGVNKKRLNQKCYSDKKKQPNGNVPAKER
jgi:hypothetical protein